MTYKRIAMSMCVMVFGEDRAKICRRLVVTSLKALASCMHHMHHGPLQLLYVKVQCSHGHAHNGTRQGTAEDDSRSHVEASCQKTRHMGCIWHKLVLWEGCGRYCQKAR